MVDEHYQLSKREGDETVKIVKRKIWEYVDERISEGEKRREKRIKLETQQIKKEDEKVKFAMPTHHDDIPNGLIESPIKAGDVGYEPRSIKDEDDDVDMLDYDTQSFEPTRESFASPVRSPSLPSTPSRTLDIYAHLLLSSTQGRSTYRYPSSSSSSDSVLDSVEAATTPLPSSGYDRSIHEYASSPGPAGEVSSPPSFTRPSKPTPRGGRDIPLNEEDKSTETPCVRPSDALRIRGQAPVYEHEDTPRPKTSYSFSYPALEDNEEEKEAFPTLPQGNTTPTRTETSSYQYQDIPRPKISHGLHNPSNGVSTSLHASPATQTRPQTKNRRKRSKQPTSTIPFPHQGRRLFPLREGFSPQHSPPEGTTEYRAAGTRRFYREIVEERNFRRAFRLAFGLLDAREGNGEGEGEAEEEKEVGDVVHEEDMRFTTLSSPLLITQEVKEGVKQEEKGKQQSLASSTSTFLSSLTSSFIAALSPANHSPTKPESVPTPPLQHTPDHPTTPPTKTPSRYPAFVQVEKSPDMPAPQPHVTFTTPVPAPVARAGKTRSVTGTPKKNRNVRETLAGVRKSARIANKRQGSMER